VVGVEGQLKQLAGFVEVLFGNELSSLVEGLHEEVFFRSAIPVVYLRSRPSWL